MIAAFLTENGISKENMAALLAGFDLPVKKPFKNHSDWLEYAKWYSVVCQEYSPPDEELGIGVVDGLVEFSRGIGPAIKSHIEMLTIEQALGLADKYRPEVGYTMRLALDERARMYKQPTTSSEEKSTDAPQTAIKTQPIWSVKTQHQRESDMLREWLMEILLDADKTVEPPTRQQVLQKLGDKLERVKHRGISQFRFEHEMDYKYVDSQALTKRINALITRN
jgi:hypothetical protein